MSDINAIDSAFTPVNGPNASTVSITIAVTTANVALPAAQTGQVADAPTQFALVNTGTAVVFVAFGATSAAAVATAPTGATPGSYAVPPTGSGSPTVVTVPGQMKFAACIGTVGGVLYITPGAGHGN